MYLLYVDESGSPQDPNQQYFVLAGVAVFERKTHWLEQALDNLASRIDPNEPERKFLNSTAFIFFVTPVLVPACAWVKSLVIPAALHCPRFAAHCARPA